MAALGERWWGALWAEKMAGGSVDPLGSEKGVMMGRSGAALMVANLADSVGPNSAEKWVVDLVQQ